MQSSDSPGTSNAPAIIKFYKGETVADNQTEQEGKVISARGRYVKVQFYISETRLIEKAYTKLRAWEYLRRV